MVILEASPDMLVCMPNLTQEWFGISNALGVDSIDLSKVIVIFFRNSLTEDICSGKFYSARGREHDPSQTTLF